ncbi:MAG: hypothetical protein RL684_171, partial [Pseudomonadota bacterium]
MSEAPGAAGLRARAENLSFYYGTN